MTVAFISHAFDGTDVRLARILAKELDTVRIDAYMAEDVPRYDLLIHKKIREAIDESDWLVAVITGRSQMSASVHEEIGYALGRGVQVAIMLKKGARAAGVLVHGREVEEFAVPRFRHHAQRVASYIRDRQARAPAGASRPGRAARKLLSGRHVLSAADARFGMNKHYARLYDGAMAGPPPEKPAVLFTACPHRLGECDVVATDGFAEWAGGVRRLEAEPGRSIPVREAERTIDVGSLTLVDAHPVAPPGANIKSYREFQDTGLFEYGTSSRGLVRNLDGGVSLSLCHVVGEFWGFLLHAGLFYRRMEMDRQPLTVALSVRNSSSLALSNRGYERMNRGWVAMSTALGPGDPRTGRRHIRLSCRLGSAAGLAGAGAAQTARTMARRICNAYGESAARCYDGSGRFAWDLWEAVPQ